MLKVGLTGGIGCGKSSAVACFRRLGVPVVDADQIARLVVQPGELVLDEIVRVFGAQALTGDGALDRGWMRARIFSDPAARIQLEAIVHPVIRERLLNELRQLESSGAAYAMADIPLLIEQHYQSLFERIIVVDCLPEQQLQRVRARDGGDDQQIMGIIRTQASRAERLRDATDVLDNTGTLESLEAQIEVLHEKMSKLCAS